MRTRHKDGYVYGPDHCKYWAVVSDVIGIYASQQAYDSGEVPLYTYPIQNHTEIWIHPQASERIGILCRSDVNSIPVLYEVVPNDALFWGLDQAFQWALALQQGMRGTAAPSVPPPFMTELAGATGLKLASVECFEFLADALKIIPIQALHIATQKRPDEEDDLYALEDGAEDVPADEDTLNSYSQDLAALMSEIEGNEAILRKMENNRQFVVEQLGKFHRLDPQSRRKNMSMISSVGPFINHARHIRTAGTSRKVVEDLQIAHLSLYNNVSCLLATDRDAHSPPLETLVDNVATAIVAVRALLVAQRHSFAELEEMLELLRHHAEALTPAPSFDLTGSQPTGDMPPSPQTENLDPANLQDQSESDHTYSVPSWDEPAMPPTTHYTQQATPGTTTPTKENTTPPTATPPPTQHQTNTPSTAPQPSTGINPRLSGNPPGPYSGASEEWYRFPEPEEVYGDQWESLIGSEANATGGLQLSRHRSADDLVAKQPGAGGGVGVGGPKQQGVPVEYGRKIGDQKSAKAFKRNFSMNNLSKTKKGESQQSSVERRLSGDSWSGTQQQAGQVSAGGTRKRKGSKGKLKDDRPPHVIPQTVQRHKLHSQRSLGSLAPLQTNLPPTSPGHSPAPSPGMARSIPLRRTSTDGTRRPKDYPELEMSRATSLEESRHVAVATANEGADTENDQEREETDSDDDKEKRAQTNQKLAKFFGDGKVPYHDEPMAHSMGHLLRETYDLVLCTGSHEIRGATLDSLMRWLTRHDRYDPEFTKLFFLCYPNFTTAEAVADSLWERFHMQPPETLTKKEKQFVTERKLKPIQNRVLTVVGYWVDEFFYDLKEMPTVLSRLMNLILLATPWNPLEHSQTMYQMMVKMVMRQEEVQLQYAPPSDFGYLMSAEEFWRCDPSEVARQCTVIEWRLFRAIRPREFLNQAWNKIHLKDRAPHILAFIERSGNVTAWVIYSILNTPTLKERIRLLRFFIKMVWDCYELNNFSTTMALLAGLRSTAVKRLKHTWEGVMPNKRQQVEQLWEMMDAKNNYSSLRRAMQHAEGPRIPYLGVYLKDLTFIDDGYPPMLADREGYINVEKWRMVTRVIKGLRAYQEDPYKDLVPREDLIAHLLLPVQAPDIDRDCERSIQLEPKDSTPDMIP